jgi:hypothetical protein
MAREKVQIDAEEQQNARPEVSDQIAQLAAYAMVMVLDCLPSDEGVHVSLLTKRGEGNDIRTEAVFGDSTSIDEVLNSAREYMSSDPTITAYAIIVDSQSNLEGFPTERPLDAKGRPSPDDKPVVAMYTGERGTEDALVVIQAYRRRRFRGGATPVGGPLMLLGSHTLLD